VATGRKPGKFIRRVQHRPSARGQEGLLRKGGERADQGASSLGKGQHVAVVGSENSRGERVQGLGLAAWTVGVHRH